MASGTADVIVVGAGITGCAVALELAREGWAVVVVDARQTAGAGATGAASGIVGFHHRSHEAVAAAWESCQWWTRWSEHLGGVADDRGSAHYRRTGGLVLDTLDADHSHVLGLFDLVGVPYEELTADQIRARFPAVDPSAYGPPVPFGDLGFWRPAHGELRGYYTPDAGYVDDPQLAAHNLMTAARHHGARFRFGETVTMIRRTAHRVAGVRLASGGTIDAPVVVNVAGPASDAVNRLADVTVDMRVRGRPLRVETHAIPAPCGFDLDEGVLVTDHDLGTAFRPQAGGLVHIASIVPDCDPLDWARDPEAYYHAPTEAVYERQAYRVARRLPGLTVPPRPSGLAALYDVTPDRTPVFDRTTLPGFYTASGTSGNAFALAPVAGPMMAELIRACESGHDHDRFPVRYACRATLATIDLGAYSRLRSPTARRPAHVLG